jgi:hypothetical protein
MEQDSTTHAPFSRHELQIIAHARRAPGSLPSFLASFAALSIISAVLISAYVVMYRYMQSFSDDGVYIHHDGKFIPMVPHFIPAFTSIALLVIVCFLFTTYLAWLLWRYQITLHKLCLRLNIPQ